MKKQFTLLFSALCILFFFSSCEKDLQEEVSSSANNSASALLQGITQQNVSLDEVKNDPYLSRAFKKAVNNIKQNTNLYKRSNQETDGLDLANLVRKYTLAQNGYTSYTIPILNDNGDSYIFQNLVIEKDVLRDAAYLITYYPDENYKESLRRNLVHPNDNIDFTGSKMVEYLYYKRKVNVVNSPAHNRTAEAEAVPEIEDIIEPNLTVCVEIYTPRQCTAGGGHTPGQSCTGNSSQQPGWDITVSCTTIFPRGGSGSPNYCPRCEQTVQSDGSNSGNSPTPFFPDNNPTPNWTPQYICVNINPTTGECSEVIPYTPIITIPMSDPYNYYSGLLSREQIDILLRVQHREVREQIDAFLEANRLPTGGFTTKISDFLRQLVDQIILNPDLNFDVNASFKSPFNIDRSAIDNNTTEGQKFNAIYDQLALVPEFKDLFINLFNDNGGRPNVKFVIEEHVYEGDNPANPEVNALTDGTKPNAYLIKINKQCLIPNSSTNSRSQTNLENAKTIAHEAIHAYLYHKINNPQEGILIPGFEQMDLPALLNALETVSLNQHNVMFTNLAPTLQKILKSLKDILTTPQQRAIVESLPVYHIKNPQGDQRPWNWDDYFKYLSYEGLQESKGFQSAYPLGSDIKFVYTQYIAIGHANL